MSEIEIAILIAYPISGILAWTFLLYSAWNDGKDIHASELLLYIIGALGGFFIAIISIIAFIIDTFEKPKVIIRGRGVRGKQK